MIGELTDKSMVRCQARWRHLAERGTAYFHGLHRRALGSNRNVLRSITLNHSTGERADSTSAILEEFRSYFESLYRKTRCTIPANYIRNITIMTAPEADQLEGPITEQELLSALMSMHSSTSPGPDGYTVPFFKTFWHELGPLICNAATQMFESHHIPPELQKSMTIVIPKKGKNLDLVESFRPISLLNVVFKILTKTLARRIGRVISRLINEDQSGFIKGRYIGENIRTVLDLLKISRETEIPGLLLFCDWQKAYD